VPLIFAIEEEQLYNRSVSGVDAEVDTAGKNRRAERMALAGAFNECRFGERLLYPYSVFNNAHDSHSVEKFFRDQDYAVRLEAKLLLERFERRRSAKRLHADDSSRCAYVAFPSKG